MRKPPLFLTLVSLFLLQGSGVQAQLVPGFAVSYYTTNYTVGNSPKDLYLGNLRGQNTFRDLIVADYDDNTISIRFCNDNGTFGDLTNHLVGLNPIAVRSANLDGVGAEDVVVANFGTNTVSVLFNLSSGLLGAATNYTVGTTLNPGPIALSTGDIDQDGVSDIAVANSAEDTVSILTSAAGSFDPAVNYPVGAGPASIQVRNIAGDANLDVLTANKDDGTLSLLIGTTGGGFGPAQTIPLFPGGAPMPTHALSLDFNNDGRADIATVNNNSNTISILIQAIDGTFPITTNYPVGSDPRKLLLRDLNSDGLEDIVVANHGDGTIQIFLSLGDGSFQDGGTVAVGLNPSAVAGSNFNDDGLTDLAIANSGDDTVSILLYDRPLAGVVTATTDEDTAKLITLRGEVLAGRTLSFLITVPPANGSLSPTNEIISAGTNLFYTGNSNFFGTDTFSYQVTDGVSTSEVAVATITVKPINDGPTFTLATNEFSVTTPGAQTELNFAENISCGPNESGQALTFFLTSTSPSFFTTFPTINATGVLSFTPSETVAGTNVITVQLRDNAGTGNGGTNGSATQTFSVVVPVFPPILNTAPVNQTVTAGQNATFSVTARGVGPFYYAWDFEGTLIPDATNSTLTVISPTVTESGGYSVTITNAGGSIAATASLTVNADIFNPLIELLSPSPSARVLAGPSITVSGTAGDNARLSKVLYGFNGGDVTNEATLGGSSTSVTWSGSFPMTAGTNVVQAKAVDFSGNESLTLTRSFIFVVMDPIDINIIGNGSVVGVADAQLLEIGKTYKVTAVAGPEYAFSNWTGTVSASTNVLTFLMQSNTVLNAIFIENPFIPVRGIYHGLFFDTNGITHESAGFFRVTVTTNLTWSGYLLLDGDKVSTKGKFAIDGTSTATVLRTRQNKSPLIVSLDLLLGSTNEEVIGTLSEVTTLGVGASTNWTASLLGDRQVWGPTNPATAWSNSYTLILPPDTNATPAPGGYGWGTVSLTTNGLISLVGGVGDGALAKQRTVISKKGKWPLYVPLYQKPNQFVTNSSVVPNTIRTNKEYEGFLLGWVSLVTNSTQTTLHPEGDLTWIKTKGTNVVAGTNDALYPAGFTNILEISGSLYVPAPSLPPTRALNATAVTLLLEDGNLATPIINSAPYSDGNVMVFATTNNPDKISLIVTPKTGSLRGSFVSLVNGTNRTTRFSGAVLQDQNLGRGTFIGTNESGAVLLDPNP